MESKILLESGTNELELLEFMVGSNSFGINIAKVNEVMFYHELTPIPESAPEVEGVFIPRDKLISIVDLHKVVKAPMPEDSQGMFIICQFNRMDIGFHVSSVKGIQRISWSDISKPPSVVTGDGMSLASGMATGIAKVNGRIIVILDFEKIVADLHHGAALDSDGIDLIEGPSLADSTKCIVVADDSPLLNRLIVDALKDKGFTNIHSFGDGEEAWEFVSQYKDCDDILSHIACVVSDIEMPKMDGHHLTKLIKDDRTLRHIPVMLFSSLINDQMRLKGESVGANAQYSKPQIKELIKNLIELIKD